MEESAKNIYDYIKNDFISLWNGIANNFDRSDGKGNFLFALYPMVLLEFACKLLFNDKDILRFAQNLNKYNKHLFKVVLTEANNRNGWNLPYLNDGDKGKCLIDVLYGTVRNGHAHTYLQNIFKLDDKIEVAFWPNNPIKGQNYDSSTLEGDVFEIIDNPPRINIVFKSDILFNQIVYAINETRIITDKDKIKIKEMKSLKFINKNDFINKMSPTTRV